MVSVRSAAVVKYRAHQILHQLTHTEENIGIFVEGIDTFGDGKHTNMTLQHKIN